jgi:hypothetical protein
LLLLLLLPPPPPPPPLLLLTLLPIQYVETSEGVDGYENSFPSKALITSTHKLLLPSHLKCNVKARHCAQWDWRRQDKASARSKCRAQP